MLTVFLASLIMVSVPVPVQSSPSPVTFYVDMPPEGYIPGKPVNTIFTVDVYVDASELTPNSTEGMVGWGLYVQVDPAVLEPIGASGATAGYFLWEFAFYWGLPYPTLFQLFDATTGYGDVSEFISPFPLGGAGGNGKLVTLAFKSLSETAYSRIQISLKAEYVDTTGTWHDVEAINGHYNQRGRVAIDQTKCDFFQWGTDHVVSVLTAEGYGVDVFEFPGTITAERLAGYCTIIIAYPQDPYTPAEVTAILDFVNSGHGLLFLGEYGPAWSTNSEEVYPAAADPITGPLGILIGNNSLRDPTNHEPGGLPYAIPHITTFPVVHPVTNGIGTYLAAGTATLEVNSSLGTTIATGDDDTYTIPSNGVGFQPVLAASEYGSGRAVVAGDHNWIDLCWGLYYDNTQLLINVIRWLCPGVHASFEELIDLTENSGLPTGTENGLVMKVVDASHLYDKGNVNGATHKTEDFIEQVEAQRGKKITNEQADPLVSKAQRIVEIMNGGTR